MTAHAPTPATATESASAAGSGLPTVSVVIPARNAETTIEACLDSVLSQDYAGRVEVIVADGSDGRALSDAVRRRDPRVRIVPNPARSTANALNEALRVAQGGIVARCDAHAVFPPGYLRRAVETLTRTGAANVGGRQHPVGRTFVERAVALAMASWLGSGGAHYRLGSTEGAVDTVYLGVFRRDALDAVGGFDPAFVRHQDYELNWRLRMRGEKVWFDPALVVEYRPRGGLLELARQYGGYGWWKFTMLRRYPSSCRVRHLAAPLLVASLAAWPALAAAFGAAGALAGAVLPAAWGAGLVLASAAIGIRRRAPEAVLLPPVLATMHLSWGGSFVLSMLRALVRRA